MERETVVICIGSDRVSGDMLGPLVGSALRDEYRLPCPVYGWVGGSVNGLNLDEYLSMLGERHGGSTVIAVDAAVGKAEDVGKVRIKRGGVKAGGALERKGGRVGDLGVIGVVAEEQPPQAVYGALLAVPFSLVESLAARIAALIFAALSEGGKAAAHII